MSEWKPIESAPDDGTRFLIAYDDGEIELADDSDGMEWVPYDGINQNILGVSKPTHWMPLPEPPATGSPDSGNTEPVNGAANGYVHHETTETRK